jgi:4-amino-4-deoxy-L-arabinose transferase-like glycosyltransferase
MTSGLVTTLERVSPRTLIATIIVVKAIAFFVALPYWSGVIDRYYSIDFTDNYEFLAVQLAAGHGYRFTADTAPTLMREPGYPLVLSALFTMFGVSLTAARTANLLFALIAALAVSKIAARLTGGELAQRIAPVAFLCHPGIVLSELRGGVECLYLMLLLLFLLSVYRAIDRQRWGDFAVAGLMLGVASLVRSTALLFPAFLLLFFLFADRGRGRVVIAAARAGVIWSCAFVVLSPWIVRNYLLVGEFVPTASVAGVSAHAGQYICQHMTLRTDLVDVDRDAALERASLARSQGLKFKIVEPLYYLYFFETKNEIAFNSLLGKMVLEKYAASPTLLVECMAKNAFHFWFSSKSWSATAANAVVQVPYIALAFAGLIIGLRGSRSRDVMLLLLFIVYTLGVYLPILAQARYSIQLMPIMSILAGVALERLLRSRPAPPFAPSGEHAR